MARANELGETAQAFETLRRFARKPQRNVEYCELCHTELTSEHPHLIELAQHKFLCSCDSCAILFTGQSTGEGTARYRRLPRTVRMLANFGMTDAEWDSLLIPINLAFFFQNSLTGKMTVLYPSPAGATESLLPLEAWTSIVRANPALLEMQPDVEALLVNRVGHARGAAPAEYYIAPIDACYRLVGIIRLHWRGLSGGTEVWQEIAKLFAGLRSQAEIVGEVTHA